MENSVVLIDERVSAELQFAIHKANETYKKAITKYSPSLVTYSLHYSYPKGGREIPQDLLNNLYVFRHKLKSIEPLPSKEGYYLKVAKRPEKYKVFIDLSIYESLLNSIRCIIYLEEDSVYYKKVLNAYKRAISGNNCNWRVKALDESGTTNISQEVIKSFNQTRNLINELLKDKDFDYVYNGVLQHSDERYYKRYIKDCENGALPFVIFKCAILAERIRNILMSDTKVFDFIIENNRQYIN